MMGEKRTCRLNVYTEISSIIHSSTGHKENTNFFIMELQTIIEDVFFINGCEKDRKNISSTIRSTYGKCGFNSVFINTGHGIIGIVEIYE